MSEGVLDNIVLDRDGRVWRGDGSGWWRLLERPTSPVVLQRSELRAIHGPLQLLTAQPEEPVRSYAPKAPPPHRRMDR